MFILAVAVRKVVRAFRSARVRHFFVERIGLMDAAVDRSRLRRSESGQGQKSECGKSSDVVFHCHNILQNVTILDSIQKEKPLPVVPEFSGKAAEYRVFGIFDAGRREKGDQGDCISFAFAAIVSAEKGDARFGADVV